MMLTPGQASPVFTPCRQSLLLRCEGEETLLLSVPVFVFIVRALEHSITAAGRQYLICLIHLQHNWEHPSRRSNSFKGSKP